MHGLANDESGQTMKEYALILGLIAVFVIIAVFFLGGKISDLFSATGSTLPVRETLSNVDEILGQRAEATAKVDAPDTIRKDSTDEVRLTVTVLPPGGQGEPQEGEPIEVTARLGATLVGREFEIVPITSEQQVLSATQPTVWRWEIASSKRGTHVLNITVTGFLPVEGETTARTLGTYTAEITVTEPFLARVGRFFTSNWQWIIGVIVTPVGLWGLKKLRDRRKTPDAGKPDTKAPAN